MKITKQLLKEIIKEEVQKTLKEEKSLLLQAMERLTMSRTSMEEKKPHLAIKNLQDAVVMLIQEISNLKTTK